MPIDLSTVNWTYVALMAVFVFVAALLGSLISFRNRFGGALIAAILFAAMFVAWNYYPHPQIQLPIIGRHTPHRAVVDLSAGPVMRRWSLAGGNGAVMNKVYADARPRWPGCLRMA